MKWLMFALMTVVSWGLYGIFLHSGQVGMVDKNNGLYKAFLFVGLAYFLTAILAPLGMLLAFANGGKPGVVMSIVFAGAPVVNAVVALWLAPPEGGWGSIKPQFYLGIILAAAGGCLVTFYKPPPPKNAHAPTAQVAPAPVKVN